MRKDSVIVPGGVLVLYLLTGCGGGGGVGTFTTSVPGDRSLGGLTPGELTTLCADGQKFSAQPTVRRDICRLTGFSSAASAANVSPAATDAELKIACSQAYDSCSNGSPSPLCPQPPATCTATVAELTACTNATAAQTHDLVGKLPDCDAIDRASINASSNVFGTALDRPASCQPLDMKCSGSSSGGGGSGSGSGDGGSARTDGGIDASG